MAVTTVAQFAAELNRPATALLEQLQSAGVRKTSSDDALTDADKERLLELPALGHGTAAGDRKKITLTRKSTSEIKQADASGKARTIQVEVRKKRVFVERDDAPPPSRKRRRAAAPVIDEAELQRREDEARRSGRAAASAGRRAGRASPPARGAGAARARGRGRARAREPRRERRARRCRNRRGDRRRRSRQRRCRRRHPRSRRSRRCASSRPPTSRPRRRSGKPTSTGRRKAAEAEAAAIRAMMNAPKKVLVAKKPEEAKPAAEGIKGTIHKKAGRARNRADGAGRCQAGRQEVGQVREAVVELGRRRRQEACGAEDPQRWRLHAAAGARRAAGAAATATATAPRPSSHRRKPVVQEVHVPETISVADLAHKMSVKASEVIKQLMKLGQMVTINQQLDQETAMIVVEEMGHKALAAKLDDPEAFLAEEQETERAGARRAARAGGHRDGPRRPRQDLAARLHPLDPRRSRRGRRHHAAHRRLSRRDAARHDHLPRHAGPRRLHRDARARREGDRHRDPGGGCRRRRDAADQGSDPPRQGGRRADRRGDEQDRQARSEPRAREERARGRSGRARRVRRRFAVRAGVGEDRRRASTICSRTCCCRPRCSSSRRRRTRRPRAW